MMTIRSLHYLQRLLAMQYLFALFYCIVFLFSHEAADAEFLDRDNSEGGITTRRLQASPLIKELVLVDGKTNAEVLTLQDGVVISLNLLTDSTFQIKAIAESPEITTESVVFNFDLNHSRRDKAPPYNLYRSPKTLTVGNHVVAATPYDDNRATGSSGTTIRISFTVVEEVKPQIPKLSGGWNRLPDYPLKVGEAQGALMGNEMIVVGGFLPGLRTGPVTVYAMDLSNIDNGWIQLADCPINFLTHAAHAVVGNRLYLCGGYFGASPGPEMNQCFVFDRSSGELGSWTPLPDLPQGRGGGGMLHIRSTNSILFTLGAKRPNGLDSTIDERNTWILPLDDVDAGWVEKNPGPYNGNHVSAVDATDCQGNDHHYVLGGQRQESEDTGNIDMLFEYLASSDEWVERARMPGGRSHTTSSTLAYGCGFVVISGSVNALPEQLRRTRQIIYYDIPSDSWMTIGNYKKQLNTPVCGIFDDYLWCSTGYTVQGYRQRISLESIGGYPTAAPVLNIPTTSAPMPDPTDEPTSGPINKPTKKPTPKPTEHPAEQPTPVPTLRPTSADPIAQPTRKPSRQPTITPTTTQPATKPTQEPEPSQSPTLYATRSPTLSPTRFPVNSPTKLPVATPTRVPISHPTTTPLSVLTNQPARGPSPAPTRFPTNSPTKLPVATPTRVPISNPTAMPLSAPTTKPTWTPTGGPTTTPTPRPRTNVPTRRPASAPTEPPTLFPTMIPQTTSPLTGMPVVATPPTMLAYYHFTDNDQGFKYRDDAFRGTSNDDHARGFWTKKSERITVRLGGFSMTSGPMSGAFVRSFTMPSEGHVRVTFDYKVNYPTDFDDGEDAQVLCSVDRVLYGDGSNDYVHVIYGEDDAVSAETIWFEADVDIGMLQSGAEHELSIGGYLTKKHESDQHVVILIDNVYIWIDNNNNNADTAPAPNVPSPTRGPHRAPSTTTTPTTTSTTSTSIAQYHFTDNDEGFSYRDDLFRGTSNSDHARGFWTKKSERITVRLGGFSMTGGPMSGGFIKSFSLVTDSRVRIQFQYKINYPTDFDDGEDTQVLCSVDGILYGGGGGSDYIHLIYGDDNTVSAETIWFNADIDVGVLSAGTDHTLALGGHLSKKHDSDQHVVILIDDISMTAITSSSSPPPPVLSSSVVIVDAAFSSGYDGFVYVDDLFRGTSEPEYAGGWHDQSGQKLQVVLGGHDNDTVRDMSGGYVKSLALPFDAQVAVRFRYRFDFNGSEFEFGEDVQVLCALDGTLYGGPGSGVDYVDVFYGDDENVNTEWRTVDINLGYQPSAGGRQFAIGGYLSKKTVEYEVVFVEIDDVYITATPATP